MAPSSCNDLVEAGRFAFPLLESKLNNQTVIAGPPERLANPERPCSQCREVKGRVGKSKSSKIINSTRENLLLKTQLIKHACARCGIATLQTVSLSRILAALRNPPAMRPCRGQQVLARFRRAKSRMRRQRHVGYPGQGMIHGQRLDIEDVEAGMADVAGLPRLDHALLID